MPKQAAGELRWTEKGPVARITIKGRLRKPFLMATCRTEEQAKARMHLLAEIAARFRHAGIIETRDAMKLLDSVASCAEALLPGFVHVAGELVGGELVPDNREPVPTFRELRKRWTSGELHKSYPDHVKAKDSTLDASRLAKLEAIDVGGIALGDIPLDRFTLEHAERAMRQLPEEAKRPATRRQYAQLINRVLALAVYPCRHIERNPLPKGFLPKAGKPPAYPYLYPDEDAALLACSVPYAQPVPLARRVLFGFLAREGCRVSEAAALTFADVDLERGSVSLDENKTDDPRAWALNPGVTRALRAWKRLRGAGPTDRVFVDEHGRPLSPESLAPVLREDLVRAGVTRKELLVPGTNRQPIRVHDLRGTFITLSLANGRTETWVADRTGHTSSQMINRYRRAARSAGELRLGELIPMDAAIPELCPAITPDVVGHSGLEPEANGLRVRCSTN